MDINMDGLPMVIYACFVLNNYCEMNNECVHEELVPRSSLYDRGFSTTNIYELLLYRKNEAEG